MRRNFDAQISDLALTVIQTLLRKYSANPTAPQAWMAKETAVQMYLAVGISGFTVRNGVSEENINPHMKAKADVVCIFACPSASWPVSIVSACKNVGCAFDENLSVRVENVFQIASACGSPKPSGEPYLESVGPEVHVHFSPATGISKFAAGAFTRIGVTIGRCAHVRDVVCCQLKLGPTLLL